MLIQIPFMIRFENEKAEFYTERKHEVGLSNPLLKNPTYETQRTFPAKIT